MINLFVMSGMFSQRRESLAKLLQIRTLIVSLENLLNTPHLPPYPVFIAFADETTKRESLIYCLFLCLKAQTFLEVFGQVSEIV